MAFMTRIPEIYEELFNEAQINGRLRGSQVVLTAHCRGFYGKTHKSVFALYRTFHMVSDIHHWFYVVLPRYLCVFLLST